MTRIAQADGKTMHFVQASKRVEAHFSVSPHLAFLHVHFSSQIPASGTCSFPKHAKKKVPN